jgi:hypothetical protein
MAEPVGKQISGVLACWFDEPADSVSTVATTNTPAVHQAPAFSISVEPTPVEADEATTASTRFFDLMAAVNGKQLLPDLGLPRPDKADTPQVAVQPDPVGIEKPRKVSAQQLVTEICQSHDSPLYQWLQRNQLAAEFDHNTHSVEQRWSPDGTYCSVRRTRNGFTHTIVLKESNTRSTQRVTGPDGTVLLHISASGAVIENNRQPALMTA